jgi:hypothetical protein
MFHNSSFFQTEEIDDGITILSEQPGPMDMKDHKVAVGENAFDLAARIGTVVRDPLDVFAKAVQTVRSKGSVLPVGVSGIETDGGANITLEQCLLVKGDNGLLVLLQYFAVDRHRRPRFRTRDGQSAR